MRFFPSLCLSALLPAAMAQISYVESQSTLTYNMSAVTTTSGTDLHFNMSIPSSHGWGAVGVGNMMTDSLIFLILPDSTNGSTISLRTTSGHVMPQPVQGKSLEILSGSSSGDVYMASAICRSCNTWSDGSLDASSTSQNFVYAVGPGASGVSGKGQNANIMQHSYHGSFTVDMTKAAVSSSSSSSSSTNNNSTALTVGSGVSASSSMQSSSAPAMNLVQAHAALLGLTFGLFLPLGVVLLRIQSLGWIPHAAVQLFACALAIAGLGIAVHMSLTSEFMHFQEAHQIVGLVAISVLLANAILGMAHHAVFTKAGKRSVVTYLHLWAGRAVMLLGSINIILGFLLIGNTAGAIGAGVTGLFVYFLAFGVATFLKMRANRQRGDVARVADSPGGTEERFVTEKPIGGGA